MKYVYDRASDSLSIVFSEGRRYLDSEEIFDGVLIDYDTVGRPIAIEFYDRASRFVDTDGLASDREAFVEHPDVRPFDAAKGDWLRARRLQLGLTQEQLAKQLSVGSNTVARWERDELKIEHAGMLKLALDALEQAAKSRKIEVPKLPQLPAAGRLAPARLRSVTERLEAGGRMKPAAGARRFREVRSPKKK